jgi:Uma2 family endonuclease
MSSESSAVATDLNGLITAWRRPQRKGFGFQSDCGLQIFPWVPDRVRFADGGFVAGGRGIRPGRGHLRVPPDFVFEVVSPGDNYSELDEKVQDYLRAGIRLVWVVVPETRWVHVYRQDGSVGLVHEDGILDGEDVLPGFSCPVRELFATADMAEQPGTSGG